MIRWDINGIYPLVNIQKAMENGPVEIVDFPINSMVIFHSKLLVHQRVTERSKNEGIHVGLTWFNSKKIIQ